MSPSSAEKQLLVYVSSERSPGNAGVRELVLVFQKEKWKQFSNFGWVYIKAVWQYCGESCRLETWLDLDKAVIEKVD